jgi:hypothetical protein
MYLMCLLIGLCPKGDDPFTPYTDYPTLTVTTGTAGTLTSGYFKFIFNGESFLFPANADSFTSSECTAKLVGLKNVGTATCTRGSVSISGGATYTMTLTSFPSRPYENNLFSNDGTPDDSSFYCDTSRVVASGGDASCTISVNPIAGTARGIIFYIKHLVFLLFFFFLTS